MKKLIAALAFLVGSSGVNAAGLDLALSNETANLSFLFNPPGTASQVGVGAMFNDADDLILYGTIMAMGPRKYEDKFVSLGAGVKIYGGDLDDLDQTVGALAIGGRVGLPIVRNTVNPVDTVFEGYFAPGITSTGDTEKLWEFSGRLQVEILPSARAYLGYRLVKVDTEDFGKVEIDDNIHLGISIDFYQKTR